MKHHSPAHTDHPTRSRARRISASAGLLCLALVVACQESDTPTSEGASLLEPASPTAGEVRSGTQGNPAIKRQLAQLRRATAKFHRFDVARAAGYTALVTHPETGDECLEHPTDGGMGRHYANMALVPDDDLSVLEPEVVIYEPMKNGGLRLVGLEYVVPYGVRGREEAPPTLFGREFLHNDTFGLWMLHVYPWKHNPAGMFATWNPEITCGFDEAVGG